MEVKLPFVITQQGLSTASILKEALTLQLVEFEHQLITDLSHISQLANPTGDMRIDDLEHQGDDRYLMHYSFGWQINNACADQLDEGRIAEKVRLVLEPPSRVVFKILTFD